MSTPSEDYILYLRKKDVEQICKEIDSVAIIREIFKLHDSGQTHLPDEAYLSWINNLGESVRSLNMPAYVGGSINAAGTKIINANIRNPTRGLARASGLTLLYDDTSVRPICIMEGAHISSLRTASVTALATELLVAKEIRCMGMIGSGVLAQAHINLLVKRLPHLRQILMFDTDPSNITSLSQNMASFLQEHDVILVPVETAEEAIREAQLIVPVTTTTVGYIQYAWLQPGAILVNVSLDDPLPEVALKADKIIVDDWMLVKSDNRRLVGRMYREGLIIGPDDAPQGENGPRRIDAQLGELVTGKKTGRQHEDDIILVNPFGLAIEDVAFAAHVFRQACARGLGLQLER